MAWALRCGKGIVLTRVSDDDEFIDALIDDLEETATSNVVRGEKTIVEEVGELEVGFEKYKVVAVKTFYSHTATDLGSDTTPEEVERADKESEELVCLVLIPIRK